MSDDESPPTMTMDIVSACQYGALERVRQLVEIDGADPCFSDGDREITPLHWAALNGRTHVVKYLVESANVPMDRRESQHGQTALHWATMSGHVDTIRYLLGARQNSAGSQGDSEILATIGPDTKDLEGRTALHYAAQHAHPMAVQILVSSGADVNATDNQSHTPLMWAAYAGDPVTVGILLYSKADVTLKDDSLLTALHWAALKNHMPVVQRLAQFGADLYAKDDEGMTPRDSAISKANLAVADFLAACESGAISVPDKPPKDPAELFRAQQMQAMAAHGHGHGSGHGGHDHSHAHGGHDHSHGGHSHDHGHGNNANGHGNKPGGCACSHGNRNDHDKLNPPPGFNLRTLRWYLSHRAFSQGFYFVNMAILGFAHFYMVLPTFSFTVQFVTFILGCVALYFYHRASFDDPGFIDQPGGDGVESAIHIAQYAQRGVEMCRTCKIARPLRSKHCRICDRCVAKFDHHCIWTNNCVGAGNYIVFMICAITQYIYTFVAFVSTWMYLAADPALPAGAFSVHRYWYLVTTHHIIVYELIFTWGLTLALTCLIGAHVRQIAINQTTNETMNAWRYPYFRDRNNLFMNPFDNGAATNALEFLNARPRGGIDWFSVFDVSDYMSMRTGKGKDTDIEASYQV